jgi:uncharacterized DUF497 family protein
MEFEADKSRSNQKKHGIDFERAQAIWEDVDRMRDCRPTPGRAEVSCYRQEREKTLVCRNHLSGRENSHHFCSTFSFRGDTKV